MPKIKFTEVEQEEHEMGPYAYFEEGNGDIILLLAEGTEDDVTGVRLDVETGRVTPTKLSKHFWSTAPAAYPIEILEIKYRKL